MSHENRVLDLGVPWEDRQSAAQEPSIEDQRCDCPELAEGLPVTLLAMANVHAALAADGPPSPGQEESPAKPSPSPADGDRPRREGWPVVPQYEILEEVGRGGMGVVFKARHVTLGRTVAIKTILACGLLQEDQVRRFLKEAKAMALLQHPNIVQIYEIGQQDEHPYLVMEYVPGESLSASLGGQPLAPRKAAELVAALARAVQVAHEQGIIHRDLKPSNILLLADGTPKLCDFGLAKHFAADADHTKTDQLMGTPSYMAPEQVLYGTECQGPSVDIHALGVVLYETLTGRPPFLADNPMDTLQLVAFQEPVPPRRSQPRIPQDLETVCLKCLAKEPRQRYASTAELADDLERFLANEPIHARPLGPVGRCRRWCRANPSRATLLCAALLIAIVVPAVMLVYNCRLAEELARTDAANRQVLTVQEKLQGTLMQEVAEHLDGDLRQLASVPLTMAAMLENRRDWDESQLERAVKDVLGRTPLIFGMCVAFEPFQWQNDQEDFALYVSRQHGRLAAMQLVPPAYEPLYRQWEWYRVAKQSPQGRWSEPYIDANGQRTPMVTFSAPIHRNGRFVGVVTADLAMDYVRDLRGNMDRLDWGPKGYCFLVSAGQQILSHPTDRYEFPGPDSDLRKLTADDRFRDLARRWAQFPAGTGRAMDFATGRPASFRFSRGPAAGWTLVNVAE
ncbi:MAG: protein kinase [Thermoguttaceae bacterium]